MSTMNFSVPKEVKAAFDRTFAGTNKSAVLTQLMRQAVEERRRRRRRARAIARLLALRREVQPVTARMIHAARVRGRP